MNLKAKVAVLTGATGGIGQAIVEKFIEEGARLVAADLNEEGLQQLEARYGEGFKGVVTDVTDYQQVAQLMDTAVEQCGTLNIVINNVFHRVDATPVLPFFKQILGRSIL